MNELVTIQGVRGYTDKNGTAHLNLEDVARGLGFITIATSGNEVIRWNTVHKYVSDLGVATSCNGSDYQSACPDFIPENIFYRLCMKAKNEVAERFQAKVADDILPSIRKHGMYAVDQLLDDPDLAIKAFTALKEEREQRKALETENKLLKPKADFFDQVAESKDAIDLGTAAKVLNMGIGRNRLFELLRKAGVLMNNNQPYQKHIDQGYFRTIEQKYIKPDGTTCINIKTVVYQKGLDFIRRIIEKKSA